MSHSSGGWPIKPTQKPVCGEESWYFPVLQTLTNDVIYGF